MSRSLRRGALAAAAIAFSIASLVRVRGRERRPDAGGQAGQRRDHRRRHQDPERHGDHPARAGRRGPGRRLRDALQQRRQGPDARRDHRRRHRRAGQAHARQGRGRRSPSRPAARSSSAARATPPPSWPSGREAVKDGNAQPVDLHLQQDRRREAAAPSSSRRRATSRATARPQLPAAVRLARRPSGSGEPSGVGQAVRARPSPVRRPRARRRGARGALTAHDGAAGRHDDAPRGAPSEPDGRP